MTTHEVLRRLLQKSVAEEKETPGEISPSRILRTAIARAADVDAGVALTVLGVVDERLSLDKVLQRIDDTVLLYCLTRSGETIGFAALDRETRSIIVEKQTTGRLREAAAQDRAFSASDVELCRPLVDGVLREVRCLAETPPLAGWTNGVSTGPRLPQARVIGLVLDEASYRFAETTLDFGIGDRQGRLIVCLPYDRGKTKSSTNTRQHGEGFERRLRDAVLDAPAALHAILHRMKMPLNRVEALSIGDVLPLPGVSVGSVRLEGPDGKGVTTARLGQAMGLRAVRLELATPNELMEVELVEQAASPDPAGTFDASNPPSSAQIASHEPAREGIGG